MPRRTYWHASALDTPYVQGTESTRTPALEQDANLVSSLCEDGSHMPVLDIDRIPVFIIPSSTPGNSHLYIDKLLTWEAYEALLIGFAESGLIEHGYFKASLSRKATFVRKPGVLKPIAAGDL
jgi:hypothetical protein